MKWLIGSVSILLVGSAVGAEPPGYYSRAAGLSGEALGSALHDIIDGHRVVSYSQARDILKVIDLSPRVGGEVELVYSPGTRPVDEFGGGSDANGGTGDWNREHVWPRSFGIGSTGPDNSDLFNLRPSDVDTNAARGSLFFDVTGGAPRTYPGAQGVTFDSDSWEPRDDEKGDLARGCFYMAVRYDGSDGGTEDLELGDVPSQSAGRFGKLLTLLRWHREDPVDAAEEARNDVIYRIHQRNRNPFIDREAFAELVFLEDRREVDGDGDGLGDFWEAFWLDGLANSADDDVDGDGATVGLEYAMRADPRKDDGLARPTVRLLPDRSVEFSYRRNRRATGLVTTVEQLAYLGQGNWIPASGSEEVEVIDADAEIVRFRLVGQSGFLRLKVEVP